MLQQAGGLRGADLPEERRWASVVFVDVSGFTALSERLDPEDVMDFAQRCVAQFSSVITRFGGSVIREFGDEVLAVFGAPTAHEDDAERAVRAALAMRDSALTAPNGVQLQVHVGVNTGEVMAGVVGGAERRDYTVHGDTVNTAARLRSAAAAATVLVGEETYRATRRTVRYRPVPPIDAKGKERHISGWEALEAAPVPEARPLGAAPLIGREHELSALAEAWAAVSREARPRLVTVLGEPGIGKSRLVAEFERRELSRATVLRGRCLPYGEALGYWAFATALKEAAGITADHDAAEARARVESLVMRLLQGGARVEDAPDVARHLMLLCGLEAESDRLARVDERVLHASACRFLEALARQRAVCLLIEDIHWADDALLNLLEFVASRAAHVPLMLVAQSRPELLEKRPSWARAVRDSVSLHLEPLPADQAAQLVLSLCGTHGVGPELVEQIGSGAGGNPLFAEELVATVAERGDLGGVPAVLKGLISARLDGLPADERKTLQVASACGKVFWESELRAAGAPSDLRAHLHSLAEKRLVQPVVPSQFRGDAQYVFKHDLIRDVAYEMLPRAVRRLLHGRLVDWIEQARGERAEEYLDVLAHHAVQADQLERALVYVRRAAERAGRAAAHRHAAALFGQAVSIAERLGKTDLLPDLLAQRGRAFASCGMWLEAHGQLEAALASLPADQLGQRADILVRLSEVCFWERDIAGLHRRSGEARALAEALGSDELAAEATAWVAESAKLGGDLPRAHHLYRRAIARAGGVRSRALAHAPLTMYLLGEIDEAVNVGHQAVEMVRSTSRDAPDTLATMYALPHLGLALAASGRYAEALTVFDEARRFGTDYEVGHFLARSIAMSAGFHLDVFDFSRAEALAAEARELALVTDFPLTVVSAGIDLLLNFARRQDVVRAERLVPDVADAAQRVGGWHGWLWQIRLDEARAEIALAREDWDDAVRWSTQAIDASRQRWRPKYAVLGMTTRAAALARLGRRQAALEDASGAVGVARRVGDPALVLRSLSSLLALDGDDAFLAEASLTAERIAAALPSDLRSSFEAADPVQRLARAASPSH